MTRDVVVNVVANLIAGAIGHLAGVATGVFKRNDALWHTSWIVALLGVVLATLLMAVARKNDRITYMIIAATLLGPTAILIAATFDFSLPLRIVLAAAEYC